MEFASIRRYLRPYKMNGRSSTTISYAFASAIAEREAFERNKVRQALAILEQDPEKLSCAYCGEAAQSWDHLVPVVRGGKHFGPGHRIRNLVPCSSRCNGEKGNLDFEAWLPNRCHYPERVAVASILTSLKARSSGTVRNRLNELRTKKLAHGDSKAGYRLTLAGFAAAVEEIGRIPSFAVGVGW